MIGNKKRNKAQSKTQITANMIAPAFPTFSDSVNVYSQFSKANAKGKFGTQPIFLWVIGVFFTNIWGHFTAATTPFVIIITMG